MRVASLILSIGLTLSETARAQGPAASDAIYVMNADGTGLRELFELPGFPELGSPSVSPDGRRIAFDGWQEGQSSSDGRVFIVNRDGTELIELGLALMPTWSADGRFLSVSRGTPEYGAWIMSVDGTSAEHLSRGWGAQWSPDGKLIAWTSGGQIVIYEVATGNERNVFPPGFQPYRQVWWNMAWSPDNDRLCILGAKSGNEQEVATLAIDDPQNTLKVHYMGTQIYADFAWRPDGNRIVFPIFHTERGRHQLFEFDPAKDDPPTLVSGQDPRRANTDVAWSRDGTELIFVSR
jgi:TolB protein